MNSASYRCEALVFCLGDCRHSLAKKKKIENIRKLKKKNNNKRKKEITKSVPTYNYAYPALADLVGGSAVAVHRETLRVRGVVDESL